MNWSKVVDIISKIIPQIKAQIAEKIQLAEKVQGAEKIHIKNINITVNYNDISTKLNFPSNANVVKLAEITPEVVETILEETIKDLKKNKADIDALPEKEKVQFVANSTANNSMNVVAKLPVLKLEVTARQAKVVNTKSEDETDVS
jgi:hypothetical protein